MGTFELNAGGKTKAVKRYWEHSVGSCHAYTALREDYRKHLTRCRKELGFRYLRFHGIFNDDMCVIKKNFLSGDYTLSFTSIDNIFDFLLSIGMKPFIELGFMPDCLKSGDATVFHYKGNVTPPADGNTWAWFIQCFVRHLVERYGLAEVRTWYFEVWNEPNLGGDEWVPFGSFWSGSMADYFELYRLTALAVKSVDGGLRVGGPATSNNAFIPETVAYCRKNNVPIDFISTHHYPTDVVLGYGVEDSKNFVAQYNKNKHSDADALKKFAAEFMTFQKDIWKKVDRGVLTQMTRRAVAEADGLPVYYTEWSSLAGLESDGPFGASFIVKTVLDGVGLTEGYSYWTFCDILEEGGQRSAAFHGGYGLLNLQGVAKAPYKAFELLHLLQGEMFEQTFSDGNTDIYAFHRPEYRSLQLMCVNHNSLLHPVETETTLVRISGTAAQSARTETLRVDEDNANALKAWREMGSPEYLTKAQTLLLSAASEFVPDCREITAKEGALELSVTLPPMGVALVTVLY